MRIAIFIYIFSLTLTVIESAHAYLDPGTGSAILQGILAALAALAIVGRLYWTKLVKFFKFGKNGDDKIEPSNSEDSLDQ